jgi:outer membrane protein assembly factor BamA
LENRGTIEMPVATKIIYQDGAQALDSWDGRDKYHNIPINDKKVRSIEVDPGNLISLDLDRANNSWPRKFYFKSAPLYFFAYEIPLFLPQNSYNLVAGHSIGGSSLGVTSSLHKPFDTVLRLNSNYDFNAKAVESTLGYEIRTLFKKQTILGFEIFDFESSKAKNDVSGGKVFLRKELWPASYGIFDANDHISLYFIRNQKIENTDYLNAKEDITQLHYRKRDESIFGITGSLGRYGPYADPDYGWKLIPTQEFAGHFFGGTESFWRTSVELNQYRLLLPKYNHKIASRMKLGWGGSDDKKLFQLGGAEGLRGYSLKTIEGSHMILGNLEYRLPVASNINLYFMNNVFGLDKLQMVGFFDLGKAWFADFSESDFKKDAGLGLRFHFDLLGFLERAVFRIDLAWPINDSQKEPQLWFGISQTF